jgi:hypothetical protein
MNTTSTTYHHHVARAHRVQAQACRLYAYAYGLEPRESSQALAQAQADCARAYDQMAEQAEVRAKEGQA